MSKLLFIVCLLFVSGSLAASESPNNDSSKQDTLPQQTDSLLQKQDSLLAPASRERVKIDTLLFVPEIVTEGPQKVSDSTNFEKRLTQNPTVGLFKSIFIPGWGQFGNKRYVKTAVIFAAEAWFISKAVRYGRRTSDFRSRWESEQDFTTRLELYNEFQFNRDKRNKFIWFTGITIFLSMWDAYVDAHLSGSPVKQKENNLELEVRPNNDGGLSASINYSF